MKYIAKFNQKIVQINSYYDKRSTKLHQELENRIDQQIEEVQKRPDYIKKFGDKDEQYNDDPKFTRMQALKTSVRFNNKDIIESLKYQIHSLKEKKKTHFSREK